MKGLMHALTGVGLLLLSACSDSPAPATATLPATAVLLPTSTPTEPTQAPLPSSTAAQPTAAAPAKEPVVGTIASIEELSGVWHNAQPGGFVGDSFTEYGADGRMRAAVTEEKIDTDPRIESRYWFEDGVFFIQDVAGQPGWDACVQGKHVGQYRLDLLVSGNVRFALVEDGCDTRAWLLDGAEIAPLP